MKQWIFPREGKEPGPRDAVSIVEKILEHRGIGKDEVAEYFSPKPQLTYDPFLMKDVEKAAERLQIALEKEKKICIYGDYDADGVTATSLLLQILGGLTCHLTYYIPSRVDEGYGLNKAAIRAIKEQGVDLIVTVDCGSISWEEVEEAKKLGMEIIVTDHHSMNGRKGADCLLINPKQEDCAYPFQDLCGCGVAFKLAQGLQRKLKKENGEPAISKARLNSTLDLVALGTVGDIVPLTGENRTLVKYGLQAVNKNQRPGLAKLVQEVGLKAGEIESDQIAFVIVPHLNAAGRMLSASTGVELLTMDVGSEEEKKKMEALLTQLVEMNQERKRVQEVTFRNCIAIEREFHREDLFIVLEAKDAHEGIAGIVAGKLREATGKPTILVTPSGEGMLKGTGRSIPGVNLYEMLNENATLFERFGGHEGACGFLMAKEKLERLRQVLNAGMERLLTEDPEILIPKLYLDAVISGEELTRKLIEEIEQIAPFGQKNAKPLIGMENLCVSKVSYMGDEKQHVRFTAETEEGGKIPCILFQRAKEYEEFLYEGAFVNLAGYGEINLWNGNARIQFMIQDIQ